MKKLFALLFFFAMVQCSMAQDARAYYLPKTKFRFVLLIERQAYRAGDYADYAAKYMKLSNIQSKSYDNQRLLSMGIEQVGVPDDTKLFNAKVSVKMELSDNGCLQAINTVPPPAPTPKMYKETDLEKLYSEGLPFTEEMQQATTNSRVAKLIMDEIYDIQTAYDELLKGTSENKPNDAGQLKLMLEKLKDKEKAYRRYFEGVSVVDTIQQVFEIIPTAELVKQHIFTFNGVPYFLSISDLHQTAKPLFQPELKPKDETGIWTNLPGVAHVAVYQNDKLWTEYNFYVAQFGILQNIGPDLVGKRIHSTLILNSATGGVKDFEMLE